MPMTPEPFVFRHSLAGFDLSRLPVDPGLLKANRGLLVSSVQAYYEECFRPLGGSSTVMINGDDVTVTWHPDGGDAEEQVFSHAVGLLKRGDYGTAEPMLRSLLVRNPDRFEILYNLGMMLSDQKRLDEAVGMLSRAVEVQPESSEAWTALGVAHARSEDDEAAVEAFRTALRLDGDNAHALRNLGGVLGKRSPEEALPLLEKAAKLMPEDQKAQFGYGRCLLALGRAEEADRVMQIVIQADPLSDIAEMAKTARTSIAHNNMRAATGGGMRPDAVFYCLDGLEKIRDLGIEKMRTAVFEVAMLGRSGLDINSSARKYSLSSLPGQFSGLHLLSLMYTGLKVLDPGVDAGIDLSKEYEAAKALFETRESP